MLGTMVTFEFDREDGSTSADRLPAITAIGDQHLPGLHCRIDWRDVPNQRFGTLYVWDSREHALRHYDKRFMDRCEQEVGIRPVVRFLEVTAMR